MDEKQLKEMLKLLFVKGDIKIICEKSFDWEMPIIVTKVLIDNEIVYETTANLSGL